MDELKSGKELQRKKSCFYIFYFDSIEEADKFYYQVSLDTVSIIDKKVVIPLSKGLDRQIGKKIQVFIEGIPIIIET